MRVLGCATVAPPVHDVVCLGMRTASGEVGEGDATAEDASKDADRGAGAVRRERQSRCTRT